ncbi:NAD(P)/FAD-dependent oxidoreductase [Pseudomonas sp. PLB05]|uniref:NAD(P)/FAD-dependent oxidoreductase n=1 Tax=Pseudomonas sp. PLB05 TaxID=2899078 RepID=UPI001E41398E|nr:FAD-dependent oxidoreductase [Pseudomonas sp. PLB05]MCD4864839.1 FAD-binding oxidoreductase [Pseudomonas sp. PLB05]
MNPTSTDAVAVIGAGLLGLCTALQLRRHGQDVVLIDVNAPGSGASSGNAGFLATESIDPLSTWTTLKAAPRLLLHPHGPLKVPPGNRLAALPWLARFLQAAQGERVAAHRDALAALNSRAVQSWIDCLTFIGRQDLLVQSGYLLAWEKAQGMSAARSECAHLERWGLEVELVEASAIDMLEPAMAGRFHHGLHFRQAWRMRDPSWLCTALFEAFIRHGGTWLQQRVERLELGTAAPRLYLNGRWEPYAKVVLCAGAQSASLLAPLGIHIPLMAERGYHLQCTRKGVINRPICPVERRIFLSPLDSGLRVVGISELGGTRLPPQPARLNTLRHHGQALLPQLEEELRDATPWMGMRPTLPDSLPVIDVVADRLGLAFGNQHLGLTQAAITAELIVSRLLATPSAVDCRPFRVARFSGARHGY